MIDMKNLKIIDYFFEVIDYFVEVMCPNIIPKI